jgi:hypothetical protein
MLFSLFAASLLGAQKLYTWTDENGVLHITEQPPPKSAKVEDVRTYKERTPEELEAIERRKEKLRRELERENQLEKKREAQLKAQEADDEAQKALGQAEEDYEKNKAYIDKLSNRKWKRKKFRKRIDRLKKETEEGFTEAQSAAERAEEAKQAAEEAEKAQ